MIDHVKGEAIAVRFEDVIARPLETCDALYESLSVRWSGDRKFLFKDKPYGAHRTANVGVRDGELIRIGEEEWKNYIDSSVASSAMERLSDKERTAIWELTGAAAARLGYAERFPA